MSSHDCARLNTVTISDIKYKTILVENYQYTIDDDVLLQMI